MFNFEMKVAGRERKEVAGLIAGHLGSQAVYQGTRGFGYLITESTGREWLVDKAGAIVTQGSAEDNVGKMFVVFTALAESGVEPIGQAQVTIPIEGHTGVTLRNLLNLLASKERLIAKTMGIAGQIFIAHEMVNNTNAVKLKTVDDFLKAAGAGCPGLAINKDTITFSWFAATLDPFAIQAYIQFAVAVNKMALAQKHSSPLEKEPDNEKYHFRVWLLRLGFIGEEFEATRKLFLGRLTGNIAFKTDAQAKEAVKKRKTRLASDSATEIAI